MSMTSKSLQPPVLAMRDGGRQFRRGGRPGFPLPCVTLPGFGDDAGAGVIPVGAGVIVVAVAGGGCVARRNSRPPITAAAPRPRREIQRTLAPVGRVLAPDARLHQGCLRRDGSSPSIARCPRAMV